MKKGWLVVHQRNKQEKDQSLKWRLRGNKKHPLDPGWERGDYRKCHDNFRKKASEGDIVFDVVYPNGAVGKVPRIIRSVFTVSSKKKSGNVLKFESFYFLDDNWENGIKVDIRRGHKEKDSLKAEDLFNSIVKSRSYNEYEVGEGPKSIDEEHWGKMSKKANEEIEKTGGYCRSCGSAIPQRNT